jgi:hypothetical protein
MKVFIGDYAAIVLPDVSELVIRDNRILNAGQALADPVCGIFLFHGENVEISRNQILDLRNWVVTPYRTVTAARVGISILMVTSPTRTGSTSYDAESEKSNDASNLVGGVSPCLSGVPALYLFDNVVKIPFGVILSVGGLGAFSIRGNYFSTGGLAGLIEGKAAAG